VRLEIERWLGTPRTLGAILAALGFAGIAGAQQPGSQDPQQGLQREMIELFGKVELRLRQIDKLLYDAAAAESAPAGGELLNRTRERGREVLEGIDRILEIARQQARPSPDGGGGAPQEPGDSPLDTQAQREAGREGTPEAPQGAKPDSGQPDDAPGREPPEPGRNELGPPPRRGETGREDPGGSAGRWGDLPPQVRELFTGAGSSELPAQYRDWIDAYHRRLNRRP
jgi:hypothetical protein